MGAHRSGCAIVGACSAHPPTRASGWRASATSPTLRQPRPCFSPRRSSGPCSSRARLESARPSWPRPSPRALDAELVRLQCYEGLDESRALYEWNYKKQLLRIQAAPADQAWEQTHDDIFTEEFLLTRPLLSAIRRSEPTVLLVDEIDKTDVEVEALLLEVLSDFQVTIPEMGTIEATRRPFVVLTSNANRELSEALKRRCLYLYIDYPSQERERDILLERVPGLERNLAEQVSRAAATLRELELRKSPSLAESIDWARTLLALGIDELDNTALASTLGVVLKHVADHARAIKELDLPAVGQ